MRGDDRDQSAMFSYVSPEARVRQEHPLRPSIPPEHLLRALLLQVLYTIRSERMLMEQLDYNLLFRWFVGLEMDDRVWAPTVFTKNRDRLLQGEIAQAFFEAVLEQARKRRLLSSEHFTVDFKGERRSNETPASRTDPEARLTRKRGEASKLAYQGNVLMENRNGLVVQARLSQVTGRSCEPSCCCRAVGIWALHESRGSVVFLGAGVTVNMFVHYVEECACVGYCYVKRFPGVVIEDGVETAIRSAVGFCKCTVPMSSTSSYRSHAQSRCDFMRSSEHLSAWSNSKGSPTTERDGSDAVFGDVLVSR